MTGSSGPLGLVNPVDPRSALHRVSLILPAFNEAETIYSVIKKVPAQIGEIIVVDGVSTDETARTARAADSRVEVIARTGRGKGNALACGFAAASREFVVALDADGSADPTDVEMMLAPLVQGTADFVKGYRLRNEYAGTLGRRMGTSAISKIFNNRFDTTILDACCGYIAFKNSHVPVFGLDPDKVRANEMLPLDGFEIDVALLGKAVLNGLRIHQQPVQYYERQGGETKTRVLRDSRRVLSTIFDLTR